MNAEHISDHDLERYTLEWSEMKTPCVERARNSVSLWSINAFEQSRHRLPAAAAFCLE